VKKRIEYQNFIQGWMEPIELAWLYVAANGMESIVEIGSWRGKSTHALLSGCKGTVWAVDHFRGNKEHTKADKKDIYKTFLKNVGHFKNLRVLKMDSSEAVKKFKDNSVDMVFIDGSHAYDDVKEDIRAWYPKAKKIICGHDFNFPPVYNAVRESLDKIFFVETLWINFKDNE